MKEKKKLRKEDYWIFQDVSILYTKFKNFRDKVIILKMDKIYE